MKKSAKRVFAVISLAGAVSFLNLSPLSAEAVNLSKSPGTSLTPAQEIRSIKGVITDIRPASSWLKVKAADGKERMLAVDANTTVWKANKPAAFSDLKAGSSVRVRHVQKNGGDFAKSIEIES